MLKIYTGIGSRETPSDVLDLMTRIGYRLSEWGWILRSGHAEGADQAFEQGAKLSRLKGHQGKMEIYLPWNGFERAREDNIDYFARMPEHIYNEARRVAELSHPYWDKCSDGAKKMHTRNVCQVAGRNLDTKSDMIICWTKNGKRGGGTGQALRIAEPLDIPIFDLAICTEAQIINFIKHGVRPS